MNLIALHKARGERSFIEISQNMHQYLFLIPRKFRQLLEKLNGQSGTYIDYLNKLYKFLNNVRDTRYMLACLKNTKHIMKPIHMKKQWQDILKQEELSQMVIEIEDLFQKTIDSKQKVLICNF